ncbi:MAG: hypothetical protein ACRD3E_15335 [Terriglobales bacterium]
MTHRWKILIVDQHEEVLLRLEHALETAGFDTTLAWHSDAFHRYFIEQEYDLVIIGHRPPEIDAGEILRLMGDSRVQRIVLNGPERHPFEEEYFYKLGAHSVLPKYHADLAERVKESFAAVC